MTTKIQWNQEWGSSQSNQNFKDFINSLSDKDLGDYLLWNIYSWIKENKARNVVINTPYPMIKLCHAIRELKAEEYKQFAGEGNFLASFSVFIWNDILGLIANRFNIRNILTLRE